MKSNPAINYTSLAIAATLSLAHAEPSEEPIPDFAVCAKANPQEQFVSTVDKSYTEHELRALYRKSQHVLMGEFSEATIHAHHFKEGTGVLLRGKAQKLDRVWSYTEDRKKRIGKLTEGESYVFFMAGHYNPLAVLPADPALVKLLRSWEATSGYTKEEIAQFTKGADRIVEVQFVDEGCAESYPCQHTFIYQVTKTIKGAEEPAKIAIKGRYKANGHGDVPDAIKAIPHKGFATLYLKKDASKDTDVLASTPKR